MNDKPGRDYEVGDQIGNATVYEKIETKGTVVLMLVGEADEDEYE